MKKQVTIYKGFERFWHWSQAAMILLLALSGFEIHGSLQFFGYKQAVEIHNFTATAFLILIAFAIFWHITTGEWRQYIPTRKHIRAYIDYYLIGIFRNAPHPTKKTTLSKLNPLQKLVYFCLKALVIPVMVSTGLLYYFYRYPQRYGIESLTIKGLGTIAILHTAGAFVLISFLIVHLYLITTGATITSNLKAMITGVEELEDGEEIHPATGSSTPPEDDQKELADPKVVTH
jgi:thiosulfate reductase cytochrome b subunit